jgi:hypothetical protein
MAGIKTNKLDHAQGSVNGNRHLKKDFEKVVQVYKDFITQDNLQNVGKQQSSQIAIVKSDGDGGGKRCQAKRANGQISQVTFSNRYCTTLAEYAKFSKDEKEALYQLQRCRKRQCGNAGMPGRLFLRLMPDRHQVMPMITELLLHPTMVGGITVPILPWYDSDVPSRADALLCLLSMCGFACGDATTLHGCQRQGTGFGQPC